MSYPMNQSDRNQLKEIAREFGRIETRVRRAGLTGDNAKRDRARADVRTFAESLLNGTYGDLS